MRGHEPAVCMGVHEYAFVLFCVYEGRGTRLNPQRKFSTRDIHRRKAEIQDKFHSEQIYSSEVSGLCSLWKTPGENVQQLQSKLGLHCAFDCLSPLLSSSLS